MPRRASAAVPAALCTLGCLAFVGCSSGGSASDSKDASVDAVEEAPPSGTPPAGDGAPTYAPTFSAIYDEIISQSCATLFCHSSDSDYLIINDQAGGYTALVNAPAAGPKCAPTGLKRVDPGHPETSLMYLKVTNPPCGSRMPILYGDVSGMLDPQPIEQIRQWIEAGAPNN